MAGCVMLYVGPEELRWVLAQFGISVAQLPLALCDATHEHWLATALIPLATIAIGANMLFRRTSVSSIVGGVAVGMFMAMVLFLRQMEAVSHIRLVTPESESESPGTNSMHGKEIPEGVVLYRIEGPLFFGLYDLVLPDSQAGKDNMGWSGWE